MTQIKYTQLNIRSFLLAVRFDGKIFCAALQSECFKKKKRKNTETKPLCKLLWMSLKNNVKSVRNYF